jgi:hypothetical protein
MKLEDLVRAVGDGDLIAARQWVADARRARLEWEAVEQPESMSSLELAIAAGLVELLAERDGAIPPAWTISVGPADKPFLLDPGLEEMPRSFAQAKSSAPEPLRKRNLLALPGFLEVA